MITIKYKCQLDVIQGVCETIFCVNAAKSKVKIRILSETKTKEAFLSYYIYNV